MYLYPYCTVHDKNNAIKINLSIKYIHSDIIQTLVVLIKLSALKLFKIKI